MYKLALDSNNKNKLYTKYNSTMFQKTLALLDQLNKLQLCQAEGTSKHHE